MFHSSKVIQKMVMWMTMLWLPLFPVNLLQENYNKVSLSSDQISRVGPACTLVDAEYSLRPRINVLQNIVLSQRLTNFTGKNSNIYYTKVVSLYCS
jgi:hypothetical protein